MFLEHCYRWVTSEGVLVFVVPAPAVGTCARLLTSQFDRICVFRLEHPESVRFNQVVVFGKRKKAHLRGEPKGADELLRIAYKPQSASSSEPRGEGALRDSTIIARKDLFHGTAVG